MKSIVLNLLMPAQQGAEGAAQNPLQMLVPIVLVILIFYFLIIRPQNKKQKETQKMLANLKKGDKIVTIGGIHGTIQNVKEQAQTVIVKVDENAKLEFSRSAISTVVVTAAKDDKGENTDEDPGEKS